MSDVYGLELFLEGGTISEGEAFDQFYAGLDELISFTLAHVSQSDVVGPVVSIGPPREHLKRITHTQRELYNEWHQQLNPIEAVVHSTEGEEWYEVWARDNFDLAKIRKRPNILYLKGDAQTPMRVLRQARIYAVDFYRDRAQANRSIIRRFDRNATVRNIVKGPQAPDGFAAVPEPLLIKNLESLYEDGFPRVTPPIKILSDEHEHLHYLREYLPLVRDQHASPQQLGKYLARLHHLGLSEGPDRDWDHYATLPTGTIITYDPDLMYHSARFKRVEQVDLADFRSLLLAIKRPGLYEPIKAARREELRRLKDQFPDATIEH